MKIPFSQELADVYQARGFIGPYSVPKWKQDGIPAYLADPAKVISLKEYVNSERKLSIRYTNAEYLVRKAEELAFAENGKQDDRATSAVLSRFYKYAARSPIHVSVDPLLARARIQMWFRNRRLEILSR
jgi:hypothetical protein